MIDPNKPKAISISLYGMGAKYAVGAIENVRLAPLIYPDWEVVVHVERGHYATQRLRREGAMVIEHDPMPAHGGMKWRFETIDDERYTHVIVRDADSRMNPRERAAVDAWLASGKDLHVMRDHRQHHRPIMGCGFGIRVGAIRMRDVIRDWKSTNLYGDDEEMLARLVWPRLKDNSICHGRHLRQSEEIVFPPHEDWDGFVGQRIVPSLPDLDVRVVLLSVEKYEKRRERFMQSYRQQAAALQKHSLEWWKATPSEMCYAPPAFRYVRKRSHWWAATCDHLRVMEETLAAGRSGLLLFEDDAMFDPDFSEMLLRAWCAMPQDWRALRLGWHDRLGSEPVIDGVLHRCDNWSGLMIANLWSAAGLVRAYDHFWHRRKMIIDSAFADLRKTDPQGWYQPHRKIIHKDPLARQRGRDK